jgi:replicative DNA helicase
MRGDDTVLRSGLPADPEAERWLLGLTLRNSERNQSTIAAVIKPADFSIQANALIWERICEMADAGEHIDYAMLQRKLEACGELATIGGRDYLWDLCEYMPDIPSCDSYVSRVKDQAVKRAAVIAMQDAITRLCDPSGQVEQIHEANAILQQIGASTARQAMIRSAKSFIGEEGFMERHLRKPGIKTPWPQFNRLTGGLKPGQLVVIAARPGVGKSTAATQIAVHAAEHGGIASSMFSLEMPGALILSRLIAGRAGVELASWDSGAVNRQEREALSLEASAVAALPFGIFDQATATIPAIRAAISKRIAEGPIGLIVVDYLQLITSTRTRGQSNRNDEVSDISRGLKLLAMEIGVPVIALSQMSRAGDKENRAPRLSDLRDSGAIEQDADIVAFLHRSLDSGAGSLVELRIEKNRTGAVGKVDLIFEAQRARFTCQE